MEVNREAERMMSVQFGIWNFEGSPAPLAYIEKVSPILASYGPDSDESYSNGAVKILYRAFRTTKEAHQEKQPYVSASGVATTWDGRLDNRADLINALRGHITANSTDVAIVAAAYEKWGADCLGKLIGDWAVSIWNPIEQTLLLAKDPIGTRSLFYSIGDNQVTWSSILDPLALDSARTFSICQEYIAGWLSYLPAAHLTPYVGICSVPPSSSVLLRPANCTLSRHWDFDPSKRLRYRTNSEYEEHFRSVLATAVERRLRSDLPVLAELSGGLDSSSIVCMGDLVLARRAGICPRLDTISWYDDSYDHIEPDSNELHWITRVEQKRNRVGYRINLRHLKEGTRSQRPFWPEFDHDRFAATPTPNKTRSEHFRQYAAYRLSHGYRVVLSGIGGDEVTFGDVPSPTPELQDLLSRARFLTFWCRLNAWASKMKKSRATVFLKVVRGFVRRELLGLCSPGDMGPVPWLHPDFARHNRAALFGYPSRVTLFGPLPSYQENIATLESIRALLATAAPQPEALVELRFPFLDRDLLEFMYAIPREQAVGIGKRRYLMKRALAGIVPEELLDRRLKGFVPRSSEKDRNTGWPSPEDLGQEIVSSSIKIIDFDGLVDAVAKARNSEIIPARQLRRTLTLEGWLRHLTIRGVLKSSSRTALTSSFDTKTISDTETILVSASSSGSATHCEK